MVIEEHAALDVITKDGSTYAIDESQIIRGSLTTSQSCSSGGGIPAGSCNTGTASVAFHAPSALSYEKLFGAKVKLYVWYGDTSKKQVGVYNVTSTERSYGVYTLSLSDNVYLLDEACYSNDTTTAAQNWLAMQLGEKKVPSVIFNMICNAYSVPHWNAAKNEESVPESGIGALSVKVPSDCCTESVKDFANYLAEYLGAIIMPDENGELHFAYMGSRTCPITIDASNIERDTYQKSPFHVSTSSWRVNHDSGIWTSWSVSGDFPENAAPLSIVVNNNPFWQSVEDGTPESMVRGRTETMLRYMWVAQGKVAYIDNVPQINPFRCTVHVPYYFRAGDRVKIIDPITSEEYSSYVTDVTWTFRGGQQISCAGEDTRTLSVSTSRNGAKKMSDYSRYLYRKSKSNASGGTANTYTKAEIDAKDAVVKSVADKAQGTADGAVSVNNTQNTQIFALQKSAHTHSNKGVLDKIEQPYTTAERDKLAGLENYTHTNYTAHEKGFYKVANDGKGHVTDAEKVTKKDITDLGIPDKDTDTTYKLAINTDGGSGNSKNNTLYLKGSDGSSYSLLFDFADVNNYCHPICKLKKLSDDYFMLTAGVLYAPTEWHFNQNGGDTISVDIGYTDVDGANNHLITDFANDILVHNVVSQNCSTTVTGYQNLVEGNANKVYGNNNLVGGEHNQITEHGGSSVVSGYGLYCDAVNQTVLGRYNAKDQGSVDNAWNSYYGKYVLIIGNGSDSNTGRSNAFAVDWDGNLWCGKDKTSLNAQVASKQDKLTAGTNITISGSTISAKDTTYSDATQSAHGLMTAADKKKLDGIAAGATKVAVDSALSATSTNPVQNKAVKAALDSKSASGHTHAMITNSALWVSGANNTAKWVKLGTLVSSGNFSNAMIRVWSGDGANGRANQNSSFEVQIKDGWQSTESATKACGVTVYRVDCSSVKVKVIPTAHDTYTVWAYLPWGYWNGNYAVYGKYKSWTSQHLIQSEEPEGTGADTAYYDQAFLTSTVANATTWNGLINDVDTYNSSDTWILVKKDNRIQHRYAGELDVNSAKTLADSGWQKPTFPSSVKSSSIRYRKQGKIVSVTGYVQFSTAQTTITVFTLPTGYRPPAKIQQFNAVDSSAQASFLTKIDTDGKVGFFGKTQGFFTTATEYYMHCTFFVD